jgi:cytochrome c551/c552
MRGLAVMIALLGGCDGPGVAQLDGGAAGQSGADFVAQRGCPDCHEDSGAGTLSGQLSPRPGTQAFGLNLTPDVETGLGGWADIQIVRAIRYGTDDESRPLCSIMPRQKDMSDREAYAIVDYLRGLPPVRRAIPSSTCK